MATGWTGKKQQGEWNEGWKWHSRGYAEMSVVEGPGTQHMSFVDFVRITDVISTHQC